MTGTYRFFRSGSVTPQNHILFAVSLTSDMKYKAKKRILQRIKKYYMKNEKKYNAEEMILYDLQHKEYLTPIKIMS